MTKFLKSLFFTGFAMVLSLISGCASSNDSKSELSANGDRSSIATQSPSTKTSEFCNSLGKGIDEATVMNRSLAAGANPQTTQWKTKPDGSRTLLVTIPDNSISGSDGCLIVTDGGHLRSATYITRERKF